MFQLKLAKMLIANAFTSSSFAQIGGDSTLSATDATKDGLEKVELAMKLCKEVWLKYLANVYTFQILRWKYATFTIVQLGLTVCGLCITMT